MCGSLPMLGLYHTSFPCFSVGIAPGWLAAFQPFLHHALRFAQHFGDVLERMQPVTDEERHHHQMPRRRQPVAIRDARLLLHEHRIHRRVKFPRANQFHLPLDGFARILVVARPMAGDEQSSSPSVSARAETEISPPPRAPAPAAPPSCCHASPPARSNAASASRAVARAAKPARSVFAQAQFAGNHLLREITFADKHRHDEHPRRINPRSTPAMPGSSFQKHSMTCANIPRRRNSSPC